jgi:hypothetical protein
MARTGMDKEMVHCAGCGLLTAGGVDGCQRLFDDESAREYGDPRFAVRRRMIVDTYCLQHPDRYCVSAISLAAHMTGLAIAVERRDQEHRFNAAVQRWLSGRPRLDKPSLPANRGSMTIANLRKTIGVANHDEVAERWAADVWTAYAELHQTARDWVRAATEPVRARR